VKISNTIWVLWFHLCEEGFQRHTQTLLSLPHLKLCPSAPRECSCGSSVVLHRPPVTSDILQTPLHPGNDGYQVTLLIPFLTLKIIHEHTVHGGQQHFKNSKSEGIMMLSLAQII